MKLKKDKDLARSIDQRERVLLLWRQRSYAIPMMNTKGGYEEFQEVLRNVKREREN